MEAIKKLMEYGYIFSFQDGKLSYKKTSKEQAVGADIKELLQQIKQNKQQAIEYLKDQEEETSPQIPKGLQQRILKGAAVRIYSKVLEQDVWLVKNEYYAQKKAIRAPYYTLNELRTLVNTNTTPEELKQLHQVKETLGGRIQATMSDKAMKGVLRNGL